MAQAQTPVEAFDGLPAGDLLLVCSDGVVLRSHSQILMLSSGVLRNTQNKTLKVEGTSANWKLVLQQLYPLHPRPELSFTAIRAMLKIAHMYDMASLLAFMLAFLHLRFPAELSPEPASPCYVMAWLALADDLQLEDLREMCLQKVRDLAHSGNLEDTLLQRVEPAPAEGDARGTGSWGSLRAVGSTSKAQRKSSDGGKAGEALSSQETWHQDDLPQLHDSLRLLSRGTLEELLASLAMAASTRYQNRRRCENT